MSSITSQQMSQQKVTGSWKLTTKMLFTTTCVLWWFSKILSCWQLWVANPIIKKIIQQVFGTLLFRLCKTQGLLWTTNFGLTVEGKEYLSTRWVSRIFPLSSPGLYYDDSATFFESHLTARRAQIVLRWVSKILSSLLPLDHVFW